MTDLETSV